jgi:hypothetical protein
MATIDLDFDQRESTDPASEGPHVGAFHRAVWGDAIGRTHLVDTFLNGGEGTADVQISVAEHVHGDRCHGSGWALGLDATSGQIPTNPLATKRSGNHPVGAAQADCRAGLPEEWRRATHTENNRDTRESRSVMSEQSVHLSPVLHIIGRARSVRRIQF